MVGLEGSLQPPEPQSLPWAGCPLPDQATQGHMQPDLGHLQKWGTHISLSSEHQGAEICSVCGEKECSGCAWAWLGFYGSLQSPKREASAPGAVGCWVVTQTALESWRQPQDKPCWAWPGMGHLSCRGSVGWSSGCAPCCGRGRRPWGSCGQCCRRRGWPHSGGCRRAWRRSGVGLGRGVLVAWCLRSHG